MHSKLAAIGALVAAVKAQQACTLTTETKPSLTWQTCASAGSCTTTTGSVVIDANWRWTHDVNSSTNCYTGNTWNSALCSNNAACAANCCLDGAAYSSTYGITTSSNALSLNFVTPNTNGKNVGSRTYLMASPTQYQMFNLLGKEFSFDVDVSQLPCGLNGALYFVSMPADGGLSTTNKAGAKYGTGYCDSQCPRDLKYIEGQANVEGWVPASNSANTGIGNHGSCCPEMDVWEANKISTAYTPHPCTSIKPQLCIGNDCGGTYSGDGNRYSGECDPDGCDFNSYRQGNTNFYGPGMTVDTNSVFTVVTQFIATNGALSEIKRFYVQKGVLIPNSASTVAGVTGNSITEAYCKAQKSVFGDVADFQAKGGLKAMGEALAGGMVLVMSLWDDYYANMLWLDSTYPITSTGPGAKRGTCPTSSGVPADVESSAASAKVIYSNIKFGAINSTYTATGGSGGGSGTTTSSRTTLTTSTTSTRTSTAASSTSTAVGAAWAQCGGSGWTGPTTCVAGYTCQYSNAFYSQCVPA